MDAHETRASGCNCFHLYEFLKFEQDLLLVLRQITHHPRIAEQLAEVAVGQHEIEMICRRTTALRS